jgi:hypothetical protein
MAVTKIPMKTTQGREGLFLLMVSEVSVHAFLAACAWTEHHGGERMHRM